MDNEIIVTHYLIFELNESDWSASRSCGIFLSKTTLCVGPRVILDAMEKKSLLILVKNWILTARSQNDISKEFE